MPKTQENNAKLKPLYLFQANIEKDKPAYFFISDSQEKIWMKQAPTDWEEIKVDEVETYRSNTWVYRFDGKEFNQLCISSLGPKKFFIAGDRSSVNLTELVLSEQNLKELGIIDKIELDLTGFEADAEKANKEKIRKKDELTPRNLVKLFEKNPDKFFDLLLDKPQEISEPGPSSNNDRTDESFKL